MGLKGKEEGRPGQAACPLPPSPNRTRKGGGTPLFPFPLSPSFSYKARERSPTPDGSRTPPGAPLGGRPRLPLPSFIYGGRGTLEHTIDQRGRSLAVCGAPLHHIPPRIYRCSA